MPHQRQSRRETLEGGAGFPLAAIVDQSLPGPGDRPHAVAVFAHCFTCNKDLKAITRISRRLAELGVTVVRFDMTGLGGSGGDFSKTNFTTNLADLSAAISWTTAKVGPVDALIGHSFGGAASLGIAAGLGPGRPTIIPAVVTIAAPSDTRHLPLLLARLNPAIQTDGHGPVSIGGRDWTITAAMLDDFRSHDLAGVLPDVQSHVLAFHSPTDATVMFDHAVRILTLVGDRASLVRLPGSDHLLTNQAADLEFVAWTTAGFIHRTAQSPPATAPA